MSDKQQKILEMAKDICRVKHICNDVCNPISACDALKYAERAVEAGYSKQEWISVVGFERYSVNEYGIVKNNETDQILLPTKNKAGYLMVCLYGNNIKKNLRVHRIVAQAFIPNPENKPCVNHKNGIKTDNRVCNIEWATSAENNLHKCRVLGKKSTNEPTPKAPVKCIETGETFESRSDAARRYKTQAIHIFECCNGKRKTAGGVHWMPLPEAPKGVEGAPKKTYYTPEEVRNMSMNEIRDNITAIRESMKRWRDE